MILFAFELQEILPYAVGVVFALALMVVFFMRRPRGLAEPPPVKSGSASRDAEDDETYANRRSASRRDGQPVRVTLSSPQFRGQMESGWVLDRSTGGLRIAVSQPIAVDSLVQVRAENAPNTIPWVTIIIRSCRDEGAHHEIGCSFETTPPWNVLLLFG